MCNLVYFSTTSAEDFLLIESDDFSIERPEADQFGSDLGALAYSNRWLLICQYGGCSCHFRHVIEPGEFTEPQDWSPEDDDDVEATKSAYDFFARIVMEGHFLDIIDVWPGADTASFPTFDVPLSSVSRDTFRFFENCRFEVMQ